MRNVQGKNYFKDNLKTLRKEAGLGQVALAEILHVGKSSISAWELGQQEPGMSALIKIADYFEVPLDYLVGRED